jgi:hypothetical protein
MNPPTLPELLAELDIRLAAASRTEREAALPRLAAMRERELIRLLAPTPGRFVSVAAAAAELRMPRKRIYSLARAEGATWVRRVSPRRFVVDPEALCAALGRKIA